MLHMADVVLALSSQWRLSYMFWGFGVVSVSESVRGDKMPLDRYEGTSSLHRAVMNERNSIGWEGAYYAAYHLSTVILLMLRNDPFNSPLVQVLSPLCFVKLTQDPTV